MCFLFTSQRNSLVLVYNAIFMSYLLYAFECNRTFALPNAMQCKGTYLMCFLLNAQSNEHALMHSFMHCDLTSHITSLMHSEISL